MGSVKHKTSLSKEAYVLLGSIRDLFYVYDMNKNKFGSDNEIMLSVIRDLVKSHKRMIKEMVKIGEYIGNPKSIQYRLKINTNKDLFGKG